MWKNNFKSIIFGFIFVIGLIVLFNSINLGKNELLNIDRVSEGGMDTNILLVFLEQSITKYRFLGTILSLLGGLGLLLNTSLTNNK